MILIFLVFAAFNCFGFIDCSCKCAPGQNVSSTFAAVAFASPTDTGLGGNPCAPIICSTTIIFDGNFGNGLPAGAQVSILACDNLSDENTVTLAANNQRFYSCQGNIFKFPIRNTNVFNFTFQLTTPISFTVVLQPISQIIPTSTSYPFTVSIPQTTTSYGYQSVVADVVLIIDGSDTVTPVQRNDTKQFLLKALSEFTINENNLNIAIIVALGDQFPVALVKNEFKSISTTNGLKNALDIAYNNSDFNSSTGQNSLAFAVQQLYNGSFLNDGYRNTISNHLVIYVTTTNSPDQRAINASGTVMSMNLFKFMAIGYQGGANQGPLTSFVGGNQDCAILSSDQTMISNKIVQKIWNADSNGGNYC